MANTQALKRRIGSVKNTKQITKAMELVAASKMRRAQEATFKTRPYSNTAREVLVRLNQLTHAKDFEYFQKRNVKARLHILITSDRGLAGAYNSNLLKTFTKQLQTDEAEGVASKVIVVGKKGARFVSRLENTEILGVYEDWPTYPSARDVRPIFDTAMASFKSTDKETSQTGVAAVDEVQIIYTDFISSITQEVSVRQILPAEMSDFELDGIETGRDINDAIIEPSPQVVLEKIVPKLIEAQLFQSVLEAVSSEQSMRMVAMKNASDNAGDLIDDLTLAFNTARQASITQELAEITGGAAAIS